MLALHVNVIGYLAGVLISLVGAAFAFRLRKAPGGVWLAAMLVATAIWSLAEAFDYSQVTVPSHEIFGQLSYLGATSAPVFFLLFALEYCGVVKQVSAGLVAVFFVTPTFVTVAAFTNEVHHLVWPAIGVMPGDPTLVIYEHGPLYWLVTLYSLSLGLLATTLVISLALRARGIYRAQGVLTIFAVSFPWFAELTYSFVPKLFDGFDPAITLSVTGAILTASMVRYHLLDIAPIPREVLVDDMADGIMVLDQENRLLEINPAALRMLGCTSTPRPGTFVEELFSAWLADEWIKLYDISRGDELVLESPTGAHIGFARSALGAGTPERHRDLFMLRDLSSQVAAERELQSAYEELERRLGEIEGLQHELREQAIRDPLTGLFNRRYLAETLARELSRASRDEYPVSLVLLDVDHFKETNDTCGHAGGDAVLRAIGTALRRTSRAGDVSCRYGGDEFVVVLPNTDTESALRRAERWRHELREAMTDAIEKACHPTVSLGVATFPDDARTLDELIVAADSAVYASKAAGRNMVSIAARPHHGASATN
jgi:diguanylate cyclase (GGDEF)-like protein